MHDQMVNKLFVTSTSRNKMPPKNIKARGRLRHSLTLAGHAIVANVLSSVPGIFPGLIHNCPGFR